MDRDSEYDKNVGNWERHRVEKLQDRIEKQTDSDGLAEMLGSMKLDMYILNERISSLQETSKMECNSSHQIQIKAWYILSRNVYGAFWH